MGGAHMDDEAWKLHVASHVLCAAIFIVLAFGSLTRIAEPLSSIQTAPLFSRLQWCTSANLYICFMSAVLNLFHITNFESDVQKALGGATAGIIKPLEYLLTCPLMMLTLVVLAGETVPVRRQIEVAVLTAATLVSGFFASIIDQQTIKFLFFGTGMLFFLVLFSVVEKNVRDHSGGTESLLKCGHGSPYKALCMKVVSTWILFPIWWLISAEGLKIVTQPEINTFITAALNILAKGVYVVFVERIRDKYLGEDSLMAHPPERTHEAQEALGRAARLGPAGAIQAVVKKIEGEERQLNFIRNLMGTEGTKNAAEFLVDGAESISVRRHSTKSAIDIRDTLECEDDSPIPIVPTTLATSSLTACDDEIRLHMIDGLTTDDEIKLHLVDGLTTDDEINLHMVDGVTDSHLRAPLAAPPLFPRGDDSFDKRANATKMQMTA